MAQIWKPNEEKSEDEDLVVTGHRDEELGQAEPENEQAVEVPEDDPRSALDALGEDVASSPARRGHDGLLE